MRRVRGFGFTLVELLVVISIIAVLLTILVPALQVAKQQATGAVCVANQRSLSMAYAMYSDDNDGRLVGSHITEPGVTGDYEAPWVCWPRMLDGTNVYIGSASSDGSGADPVTLEDRLRGIREGALFAYIESTESYHCPGDRRMYEGTYIGDTPAHRIYRSYSIQFGLNYARQASSVQRMTSIPQPEETYAFVEEPGSGGSFNCNSGFILNPETLPGWWWSIVSNWHNDSGTLGFADGHAERKVWLDERTCNLALSGGWSSSGWTDTAYQPDNVDLQYLSTYYARKGGVPWYEW